MDNLVKEANDRLQAIIDDLLTIKEEYERKINANAKAINKQLALVKKYKENFYTSKLKVEKMNADIAGFEKDYESLVNRFKDDELASILVNVNKEISAKIEERKRNIISDKKAMNSLVTKAEIVKEKLVKLTAEKNALELCYAKICDAYDYYDTSLSQIIEFSNDNVDNLCSYFVEGFKEEDTTLEVKDNKEVEEENITVEDNEEIEKTVDEKNITVEDNEEIKETVDEEIEEDIVSEEEEDIEKETNEDDIEEESDIEEEDTAKKEIEEEIEFSEDDFIPDDQLENVIDLNKLNEEAMKKEAEDDVEEDSEASILEEDIEFDNDKTFSELMDMVIPDDLIDDESLYEEE